MSEHHEKLSKVAPAAIRYIKLGPGGAWEAASLNGGRIDWGDLEDPHDCALEKNWAGAKQAYLDLNLLPATATSHLRELTDFYTLDADSLWITFARGHLWWGFAEPAVLRTGGDNAHEGASYASGMSTKHVRSAADLARFKCALRIECGSCGNSTTVNGFDVAKVYGTGAFAAIQPRMKCSRCGRKGALLTILSPPPPRG